MADSFVLARHYCMRYRSETLALVPEGPNGTGIRLGFEAGLQTATMTKRLPRPPRRPRRRRKKKWTGKISFMFKY